jgi:hypothetical protein
MTPGTIELDNVQPAARLQRGCSWIQNFIESECGGKAKYNGWSTPKQIIFVTEDCVVQGSTDL